MSCGSDFIFIDFDKKMCQYFSKSFKTTKKVKTTTKSQYSVCLIKKKKLK